MFIQDMHTAANQMQILHRAICGTVHAHGNISMNSSVQTLRPLLGKGHFYNKISFAFAICWNKWYICIYFFFIYRRKPSRKDKNNNSNCYWVFKQVFCVYCLIQIISHYRIKSVFSLAPLYRWGCQVSGSEGGFLGHRNCGPSSGAQTTVLHIK